MSRNMTKPTKWLCAQQRRSLGIHPVWSESSLCAHWVAKDPSFLHADSGDSDQTVLMPRLIWVFAGRTLILLVLSCRDSVIIYIFFSFILQGVFVFNLIQYAPLTYDKYEYPTWADGLGWILALFPLIWLLSSMIWKITTVKGEMSVLEVGNFDIIFVFLDLQPLQIPS